MFCFRYSAEEIHFNLMALVSSRKTIHLKDIDRLNQRRTQILDNVCQLYLLPGCTCRFLKYLLLLLGDDSGKNSSKSLVSMFLLISKAINTQITTILNTWFWYMYLPILAFSSCYHLTLLSTRPFSSPEPRSFWPAPQITDYDRLQFVEYTHSSAATMHRCTAIFFVTIRISIFEQHIAILWFFINIQK